jgi:hypothetical protein
MEHGFEIAEQFPSNNIFEDLANNILKCKDNSIEEQLEKLIKPYVDVEKFGLELSKCILDNKNLDIKCVDNGKYTRYSVINKITLEEDFFLVSKIDIIQEGNTYKAINYISDIVRGIKHEQNNM